MMITKKKTINESKNVFPSFRERRFFAVEESNTDARYFCCSEPKSDAT